MNNICAIRDVPAPDNQLMNVSCRSGMGNSYAHRVNRAGYAHVRPRFEAERRRSTRSMTICFPPPLFSFLFYFLFADESIPRLYFLTLKCETFFAPLF